MEMKKAIVSLPLHKAPCPDVFFYQYYIIGYKLTFCILGVAFSRYSSTPGSSCSGVYGAEQLHPTYPQKRCTSLKGVLTPAYTAHLLKLACSCAKRTIILEVFGTALT